MKSSTLAILSLVALLGPSELVPDVHAGSRIAARTTLVHAIDGRDLGLSQSLPVNICVNGAPAIKNLTYRSIRGPFTVAPQQADLSISLAGGADPCGDPVISATVSVGRGQDVSIAAHLSAAGTPTASVFENQLGRLRYGTGRVALRHTAQAPAVDVLLLPVFHYGRPAKVSSLRNGRQATIDVPAGFYVAQVFVAGTSTRVLTRLLIVPPGSFAGVYVVGTPPETLDVLVNYRY